jgi:2-dehydro-3-deoxyglucarate aldolase/4-hydroxy-2-oxoheptanedioate aldolase
MVRVVAPEYHRICPLLDNGAQGIIVPRVEEPEVVARIVSFCRFPPEGIRGCPGPLPANDFRPTALADYLGEANGEVLVAVQAESHRAVEAIDEIAAVPGLALVILGPADLSISLGVPGQLDHPSVVAHAERIIAACTARGVAVGIAGVTNADFWVAKGIRFLCCIGDLALLSEACHARAYALRGQISS